VNLTAAGLTATVISFAVAISAVVLVVGPWMNRQPLAVALSVALWIQVFRYVALQIFSALQFGFVVSASLANEIAWGDVAGALLALLALWLVRYRSAVARLVIWLLVIESVLDLGNATIGGIRERALETAHAVTWLNLTFYAPTLWVGVGVLVWQLVARRHEALTQQPSAGTGRSVLSDLPKTA
jgi:hypothetical protein